MNNGKCVDPHPITVLTDFLVTTQWRPSQAGFEALHCDGSPPTQIRQPYNHTLSTLNEIYDSSGVSRGCCKTEEVIPLYWSAGLLIHPNFLHQNTCYIYRKGLCCNSQLCFIPFLSCVSCCCHTACCCCRSGAQQLDHLLSGQVYLGITTHFFKRPKHGLILSSFQSFNPHITGYQQIPWFCNLAGIPIWSQSGSGKERVLGINVKVFNTHNPAVQQHNDVILVTYLCPPALKRFPLRNIFHSKTRFYWPLPFFTQHCVQLHATAGDVSLPSNTVDTSHFLRLTEQDCNSLLSENERYWCVASREHVYAAVLCTRPVKIDYTDAPDAAFESHDGAGKVYFPRLVCNEAYHSWVVVVGTKADYPTVEDFIRNKLGILRITEHCGENLYKIVVDDNDSSFTLHYTSTI